MFRMQIEGGLFGNVCSQLHEPRGAEDGGRVQPQNLFRVKDNS